MFEKKLKLQVEITQIRTNGSVWLEPMRELIEVSKNCGKIALAKNNSDEVATIGKTIGSNYFLTDRHLTAVYKKGFDTAFSELTRFRALGLTPSHSDCERDRGVEPLFSAWKADVEPIN